MSSHKYKFCLEDDINPCCFAYRAGGICFLTKNSFNQFDWMVCGLSVPRELIDHTWRSLTPEFLSKTGVVPGCFKRCFMLGNAKGLFVERWTRSQNQICAGQKGAMRRTSHGCTWIFRRTLVSKFGGGNM